MQSLREDFAAFPIINQRNNVSGNHAPSSSTLSAPSISPPTMYVSDNHASKRMSVSDLGYELAHVSPNTKIESVPSIGIYPNIDDMISNSTTRQSSVSRRIAPVFLVDGTKMVSQDTVKKSTIDKSPSSKRFGKISSDLVRLGNKLDALITQ